MKLVLYKIKTIILLVLFIIITVNCVEKPKTITLKSIIYDQNPYLNPNFQPPVGDLTKGMVKNTLNKKTRVPELVTLSNSSKVNVDGRIIDPNLFKYFFAPNNDIMPVLARGGIVYDRYSGGNIPIQYSLTLTYNENSGLYEYVNKQFFPIDYKGFDNGTKYYIAYDEEFNGKRFNYTHPLFNYHNANSQYHNYHFCLSSSSKFTYQGGEVFKFSGDDDVWVFIDNRLAVDLGGLHNAKDGEVYLDRFSLTRGITYNFDFFYCERRASDSTIKISTSMNYFCAQEDYCGVCNGDGSTCCSPIRDCDDKNECTDDYCPRLEDSNKIKEDIKENGVKKYCRNIPKINQLAGDKCNTRVCNKSTGIWSINSTTICKSEPHNCLVAYGCDFNDGCKMINRCEFEYGSNKCFTGQCSNGTCLLKNSKDCIKDLEPSGKEDPCYSYSCDVNSGCIKTPKCLVSSNPCINSTCSNGLCRNEVIAAKDCCRSKCILNKCQYGECNKSDGSCNARNLTTIDDGNLCTIDSCNLDTGKVSHIENGKCSGCMVCDPMTGGCIPRDEICDDSNQCTKDKCIANPNNPNNGTCTSNASNHCDLGNKCKVYTCDNIGGCNSTDRVCPDEGKCQVGYCDEKVGCKLKPRECKSNYFCLVSECDENYGCITYDKRCLVDDSNCQVGLCFNGTDSEEGKCIIKEYDPKPFVCNTAAVVSTAVIIGVVIAASVVLVIMVFAGKKGYDFYKDSQLNKIKSSNSNPLYESRKHNVENPLYSFKK